MLDLSALSRTLVTVTSVGGLQSRTQNPGLKLFLAETVDFTAGQSAGGGRQDLTKYSGSSLFYGLRSVDDGSAIDVHIVGQSLVECGIRRKFDRRCRLAAEYTVWNRGLSRKARSDLLHLPPVRSPRLGRTRVSP